MTGVRWLLVCAAMMAPHQVAAESIIIEGKYEFEFDRLRPDPRVGIPASHSFRIQLSGDNKVSESFRNRTASLERSPSRVLVLGEAKSGSKAGEWRVASQNELRRVFNFPQNVTALVVAVAGRACTLHVSWHLKEGFREFTFRRVANRQWAYYTKPRLKSASCTIS
jgi:hypothetical protein